jgi:hypothetical protein
MIIIDLVCDKGHSFEGWFPSLDMYKSQCSHGLINCPDCGSSQISRAPSVIHVEKDRKAVSSDLPGLHTHLQHIIEHVLFNSEDVGENFADEARQIFHNESPRRAIHGEATLADFRELREEGIDVMLIPALLKRKNLN